MAVECRSSNTWAKAQSSLQVPLLLLSASKPSDEKLSITPIVTTTTTALFSLDPPAAAMYAARSNQSCLRNLRTALGRCCRGRSSRSRRSSPSIRAGRSFTGPSRTYVCTRWAPSSTTGKRRIRMCSFYAIGLHAILSRQCSAYLKAFSDSIW